jgi:peroxiredoxin
MRIGKFTAVFTLSLAASVAADVPRQAPEFVINMPQGGYKLLSEYRGKVVALEFLYTTCPHCQVSAKLLSRFQTEYGAKGFQALGVAFNPMSKMLAPDFVKDFGVNFPVGYAERDPVSVFLQSPLNESLHVPQLVFIDRSGRIRQQSLPRGDSTTGTEANMRKMIETLLAEKPAPVKTSAAKKKTS